MKSAQIKKRERGRYGTADVVCVACPHCGRDHWMPEDVTGVCRYGKSFKIIDTRR